MFKKGKQRGKTLEERFWEKVKIGEPDECWEWQAGKSKAGYGKISGTKESGYFYSHRKAWELTNGEIPDGMHVLHKCDNPPCCNPRHLWLGTQADNNRDRDNKGRSKRKLAPSQIIEIRLRYANGEKEGRLAKEYGVSFAVIWPIVRGRTYREI